ncbi:MAG: hypothetical protein K1X72_00490 [Pyrinomonadaceae bacterium]|nr:hypothetical protein [Pyrinomonadaceae bacterium]
MNTKTFFGKALLVSLVFIISLISTNIIKANTTDEPKKIIGVWQLKTGAPNKNTSQTKPDFFVLPVSLAPESLILATDENVSEITINECFKTFVTTQTLPIDGTTVTKNVGINGKIWSKAYWLNNKLIVEISTNQGDQITETFELSLNQKQLVVTVQTKSGKQNAKITKSRRAYSRVVENLENEAARVGITDYPF